jgi:hypothetical protein
MSTWPEALDEREPLALGLHQLRRLRTTALARIARVYADPEWADDEADNLYYQREIFIVDDESVPVPDDAVAVFPDEQGNLPSAQDIVLDYWKQQVAYYDACIGDYKHNFAEAVVAQVRLRTLSIVSRPSRPRAREHSPRRQRARSSASGSRDPPKAGADDDPHEHVAAWGRR